MHLQMEASRASVPYAVTSCIQLTWFKLNTQLPHRSSCTTNDQAGQQQATTDKSRYTQVTSSSSHQEDAGSGRQPDKSRYKQITSRSSHQERAGNSKQPWVRTCTRKSQVEAVIRTEHAAAGSHRQEQVHAQRTTQLTTQADSRKQQAAAAVLHCCCWSL